MAEADDDSDVDQTPDQFERNRGRCEGHDHGAGVHRDERLGVLLAHRADELGWMDAFAARIDEGPLDMHAERTGHANVRLARRRQRPRQHFGRVGDDRRQEAGDPLAPVGVGDPRDCVQGRLGVEQRAAAAIDLPVDEPGRQDPAAEIDRLAAARAVPEIDERADRPVLDDERMIVEKPLAVEQARPIEHLHRATSSLVATAPPAIRIAPSVASWSGVFISAATSGSR